MEYTDCHSYILRKIIQILKNTLFRTYERSNKNYNRKIIIII